MNYEKPAGNGNIAYAALMLMSGILFSMLFPVKEIGSNHSLPVNPPGRIPVNMLATVAALPGITGL